MTKKPVYSLILQIYHHFEKKTEIILASLHWMGIADKAKLQLKLKMVLILLHTHFKNTWRYVIWSTRFACLYLFTAEITSKKSLIVKCNVDKLSSLVLDISGNKKNISLIQIGINTLIGLSSTTRNIGVHLDECLMGKKIPKLSQVCNCLFF